MSTPTTKRLSVVILNYRTPDLVIDCLHTLIPQIDPTYDVVVVVDNNSGDDSAGQIGDAIVAEGWEHCCRVIQAGANNGFSSGNNIGVEAQPAEIYYLLNSDTLLRDDSIAAILAHFDEHPDHDLVGPRLEWQDGEQQVSCFRVTTPLTELVRSAGLRMIDRLFAKHVNAIGHSSHEQPGWLSFAAIAIRSSAWDRIGPMDDGFFMFYEDLDYGRRATTAGCRLGFCERARVVHLQGGSTTKKSTETSQKRLPPYFYAARSRYFAKYYGPLGPALANLCWTVGWLLSGLRRLLAAGGKQHPARQWRDIWYGTWSKTTRHTVRFAWS